jgi:hypothetical protein
MIVWYLRRCCGAFHHGPYGDGGVYVRLMKDQEYADYQMWLIQNNLAKVKSNGASE